MTKCPWLYPILYIATTLHIRHSLISGLSRVQTNSCGSNFLFLEPSIFSCAYWCLYYHWAS